MKKRYAAMIITCATVCAAFAGAHYGAGEGDAAATASVAAPGYRVYIDEATRGIVSQPNGTQPVVLDKDAQNALSTSSAGLQEVPSPVAGGGVMAQLDGRFQNTTLATIDEAGRLVAPCVSGLPDDDQTKERP